MNEDTLIKEYFSQPGFKRFLSQLQHSYENSTNGARGYVLLKDITDIERQTLDNFYGIYSPPIPQETKRYSIKTFERLLKNSRFSLTVPELFYALNGEALLTRQEHRRARDEKWERLIGEAIERTNSKSPKEVSNRILAWLEGLRNETSPGSRTLRKVFATSYDEASKCLDECLLALDTIAHGSLSLPIRLPILASHVTGNAHALDWKFPLGRLFWWGLTFNNGESEFTESEEEDDIDNLTPVVDLSHAILLREGYRKGGIADDDISSQVLLFAPGLFGVWQECILTLRQVERLNKEQLRQLHPTHVHMVENPSVFAELVDAAGNRPSELSSEPIIICGNGQPTVAVIKLLDWLISGSFGTILHYSGDIDSTGLSIAQSLHARYSQAFKAWCMDKEHYVRYANKGLTITESEQARLKQTQYRWDEDLGLVVAYKGVKLHQELWVEELVSDFLRRSMVD
jgi:uncharacterized protein (TIGR02679 family)